jgi:hypothetical protein
MWVLWVLLLLLASLSPSAAHHRAAIAGLKRAIRNGERPADDAELIAHQQALTEINLTAHVQRVLDTWPPLPPEKLDRIAALLSTDRQQ